MHLLGNLRKQNPPLHRSYVSIPQLLVPYSWKPMPMRNSIMNVLYFDHYDRYTWKILFSIGIDSKPVNKWNINMIFCFCFIPSVLYETWKFIILYHFIINLYLKWGMKLTKQHIIIIIIIIHNSYIWLKFWILFQWNVANEKCNKM